MSIQNVIEKDTKMLKTNVEQHINFTIYNPDEFLNRPTCVYLKFDDASILQVSHIKSCKNMIPVRH